MRASKTLAVGALLLILLLPAGANPRQAEMAPLLRLHVRANSDSPADQALKYHVRNAVLDASAQLLSQVHSAAEAEKLLAEALPDLQDAARAAVIAAGFSYPVSAQLGEYSFPTRLYGDRVYRAGRYRALQIYIGDGYGQNWWCVLFPPLCFVEAGGDGAAPAAGDSYIPPRPRSRLLEWWQRIFPPRALS
ncbi:MAG: stage II sporulation protein R [Dethiobacter sp.]|jgi:stage II sporulation protein R|nr:stage II sporulation protein R [Dethiobacter sp.]